MFTLSQILYSARKHKYICERKCLRKQIILARQGITQLEANMTDETNQVTEEATEASQSNSLDSNESKGFSQDEVNRIVADRVARERKKFDGIDLDQYKNWQTEEDERKVEQQKQRGEFEKVIKEQADKFQTRIGDLENTLKREKVDGALLNSAASLKSVAPSQVADLLKNRVRLNEQGEAEVIDDSGTPSYKDDGSHMQVKDLVSEFLTTNPHFAAPSQSGTGSQGKVGGSSSSNEVDVTKLDMGNPSDRAKYAEFRKKQGIS